ncbi:Uncharacterized protein PHPALM_4899 [Phytophthora palmivora]|uniref:Integrase catalytic domain-containing protein n=1 Tax=Phytophthora palmivora TaxID=4796 RepID=A0A2P4YIN9_9STRA|nr:Uncharacterized protein PHPALM_4899 [Phytophthora palmivora]
MSLDFVFGLPADDKGNTKGVWDALFHLLGTELTMSTADHPQTDGQTERVNRVLEDTLRSICAEAPRSWSDELPVVEFALNNAVHASTGFTPFYLNGLRHPQVPLTLRETPLPPSSIMAPAEFLQGGSWNSAVNPLVKLLNLEIKRVHVLTKDIKTGWFARLGGGLTAKLNVRPGPKVGVQKEETENEPHNRIRGDGSAYSS